MCTLRLRVWLVCLVLCGCGIFLFAGPMEVNAAPHTPYDYSWRDDFAVTELNPNWAWVREDNTAWSLSANSGYMRITTQQGFLLGSGGDAQNLLLQTAPTGDYQITTQVFYEPTANFQIAGLLLYEDDENFLMLGRAYASCADPMCQDNAIYFNHEENGSFVSSNYATPTTELDEAYLRVVRSGNSYSGYYSEDGSAWDFIGTHTTAHTFAPRIGLATDTSGLASGGINADFEFFQLDADFPFAPLANTDTFTSSKLNKRWSWIDEDATHWSLTARPGFLRITTQPTLINNRLLQVAPFGDYQITTKVDFSPVNNFEIAALYLYQDNDNHLVFGHAFCGFGAPTCAGSGVYFDHIEGGNFTGSNFATAFANTMTYLRVVREGTLYSGFYSADGVTWNLLGRHSFSTNFQPKVGLVARGSANGGDPEINADFDSFAAACAVMDKPGQMSPLHNSVTTKTKVTLKWYGTPCAPKFQVQLRRDNKKTGALLLDKQVSTTLAKTPTLAKGHTYFWRMRACNGATCGGWSGWFKFKVN